MRVPWVILWLLYTFVVTISQDEGPDVYYTSMLPMAMIDAV
jgi:hypothetical protein